MIDTPFALLLAWLTLAVAIIISLYWFKWLDSYLKLLALFLWVTASANFFGLYIKHTGTNLSVLPVLSLATLLIFSKIYLGNLIKEYTPILIFMVIGAILVISFDIYFSYNELSVKQLYALGTVSMDICVVVFCLCYYWKSLKSEAPLNQELWLLNSVFFLYFSISSLLFLSINFLINESLKVVLPFWILNALSSAFLYSFLSYKIWRYGRIAKTLN